MKYVTNYQLFKEKLLIIVFGGFFSLFIGYISSVFVNTIQLPMTVFSFLILILIIGIVLLRELIKKNIDFFNPILFVSFLFFYYFVMPLFDRLLLFKLFPDDKLIYGSGLLFMQLGPEDDYIVFKAVLAVIIGVFMFYIGYYSKISKIFGTFLSKYRQMTANRVRFRTIGFIYLFIGLAIPLATIMSSGGIEVFVSTHWAKRFEEKSFLINILIFVSRVILTTGIISLFIYSISKKSKVVGFMWFIFTALILAFFMLEGGRRAIIELLISFLIIWHYLKNKITILKLTVVATVLFALVAVLDVFRSKIYIGFSEFLNFFADYDLFLLLRKNTEYNGIFDTLIAIVDKVPKEIDFSYGVSFAKIVFALIPRSIWTDKPLPVPQQLAQYLYSNEAGFSVGASIVGEAYLNFGYVAIIITMFLFGIFARAMYIYFIKNSDRRGAVLFYAVMFPLLFEIYRGPISDAVWLIIVQLIVLLPVIKLSRRVMP